MSEMTQDGEWMHLEINGRREHVGRGREVQRFGTTFLRIEVLQRDGTFVTRDYGGGANFCTTAITSC